MTVTHLNNTLLEGVLRTILAFDTLNIRLSLSQIKQFLVFADADERNIMEVLDFLCESRILTHDAGSYVLYSRQDENLITLDTNSQQPMRNALLRVLVKPIGVTGMFEMFLPNKPSVLVLNFRSDVPLRRKDRWCKRLSRIFNSSVVHSGIVPKNQRNVITSVLIANAEPLFDLHGTQQFWNNNEWVSKFVFNRFSAHFRLKNSQKGNRKRGKKALLNSSKTTGQFNLAKLLDEYLITNDFEEVYASRLLYASQWIMPQIRHAIKRNRIV